MIRIDGRDFDGFVDAGENIAQIAVAKIAHVGASESLAIAKTPTRIRLQQKISGRSESHAEIAAAWPAGENGGAGTAMDLNNQRIFFGGVEIRGIDKPALHFERI